MIRAWFEVTCFHNLLDCTFRHDNACLPPPSHGAAAFTRANHLVTVSVASVADQQRLWQHRARVCAAQCAASR